MSTDLRDQIAEYGSQLRIDRDPFDVAAVLERAERVRPIAPAARPVRSVHRWRIAGVVAAAAIAVLIVVGAPLLLRSSETSPPATTGSTVPTTAVETDDATPPPTSDSGVDDAGGLPPVAAPAELQVEWQTFFEGFEGGPAHVHQVVGGDGQWMLYRSSMKMAGPGEQISLVPWWKGFPEEDQAEYEDDLRTILWTSDDGITWEPHHLEAFDGTWTELRGEVNDIYVVWVNGEGTFMSRDLERWEPIDLGQGDDNYVGRLAATDTAVIVHSGYNTPTVLDPDLTNPRLIEVPGIQDGWRTRFLTVVATTDRFYATVDEFHEDQDGTQQVLYSVWSSADGIEWEREVVPGLLDDNIEYLPWPAANSRSVLIYQYRPDRMDGAWISVDGSSFAETTLTPAGSRQMIAATEDGFIIGQYASADGDEWNYIGPQSTVHPQLQASGSIYVTPVNEIVPEDHLGPPHLTKGIWRVATTRP